MSVDLKRTTIETSTENNSFKINGGSGSCSIFYFLNTSKHPHLNLLLAMSFFRGENFSYRRFTHVIWDIDAKAI